MQTKNLKSQSKSREVLGLGDVMSPLSGLLLIWRNITQPFRWVGMLFGRNRSTHKKTELTEEKLCPICESVIQNSTPLSKVLSNLGKAIKYLFIALIVAWATLTSIKYLEQKNKDELSILTIRDQQLKIQEIEMQNEALILQIKQAREIAKKELTKNLVVQMELIAAKKEIELIQSMVSHETSRRIK